VHAALCTEEIYFALVGSLNSYVKLCERETEIIRVFIIS
jgi:hypothetical protein